MYFGLKLRLWALPFEKVYLYAGQKRAKIITLPLKIFKFIKGSSRSLDIVGSRLLKDIAFLNQCIKKIVKVVHLQDNKRNDDTKRAQEN